MKALDLFNYTLDQDIHLTVIGGSLKVDAPKGLLPPELVDQFRKHKTEIIRCLLNVDTMIERACDGQTISYDQLKDELVDDLRDIESGELTPRGLRLVARTLDFMRYTKKHF